MRQIIDEILAFREARDWQQFHTIRHLAAALSIEAAELQEVMLWLSDCDVSILLEDPEGRARLLEEIADVLIFALLFCEAIKADPEQVIRQKIKENEQKYPVALSRGNATKYDSLRGSLEG